MGSEHPNIVPYGSVFLSKDGLPLVLAIGDDRQFGRLCAVLGNAELASRPDFTTNSERVRNRAEVNMQISQLIAQHSRGALLSRLQQLHVPAGAVNSIGEVFAQPQARSMVLSQEGRPAGLRQVAFKGEGLTVNALMPPPGFGQHTAKVMHQFTEQEGNQP
jgi:crotonobetainyl-CoA:carnitine CoA-transferase CaiB-like acyl-CoA transferase